MEAMDPPLLRSPKRVVIDTAGKWRELVLPARWGRGKGLTELASRWTTTALPEVDALLATQPSTAGFVPGEGEVGDPEIDLVLEGDAPGGKTLLVAVAVGDEPLGPTVDQALYRSLSEDRLRGGAPPVEQMARTVFNIEASLIGGLRYRLLQQNAALLRRAEARGCPQAVLLFHEFRSPLTPTKVKVEQRLDMEEYLRKVSHRGATSTPGLLAGPFFNGTKVNLFVGRALVES